MIERALIVGGHEVWEQGHGMSERAEFGDLQAEMTAQWLENVKSKFGNVSAYIESRQSAYLDRWREAGRFIDDGSDILDIGGGYIYDSLAQYLIDRRFSYRFRDVDQGTVDNAKEVATRLGLNAPSIEHGFNDNLTLPDGDVDAVFSSHCIEHSIDLQKTFQELYRVIRPGGNLLMGVPFGWEANPAHPYFFGPNEWVALVQDAGFEIRSAQISYELAESGADYFIAARKTKKSSGSRIDPRDYLKDSFQYVSQKDQSVSYVGQFDIGDEFAKSIQDGAIIRIDPPAGATQILPILNRYEWAGRVSLRSGAVTELEDLYSWYPYVMPTRPLPVRGSCLEVEVTGRNDVSRWTEVMFAGYMWR